MVEQESFLHYLPVSAIEVGWGAYLAGAGRETAIAGQPYPPRKHPVLYMFDWHIGRTLPEFQIILITNGKGEFESKPSGKVTIEGSTLLFLFPDVWHRYRPDPSVGWTERWVSFNGELIHRLYGSQQLGPGKAICRLTPEVEASLVRRFDDFLCRVHSRPTQNSLLYSIHTMSLVADVAEIAARLQSTSGQASQEKTNPAVANREVDPVVTRALEIIWTHSHRALSVEEIAKHLPIKRRTLDRRFSEATGRTVLEEINRCRLARAKRLLRETNLPIKAVARLAGFANREHLRVVLQANMGMAPKEFRDKHGHAQSEENVR